jgi:hypothetical protein
MDLIRMRYLVILGLIVLCLSIVTGCKPGGQVPPAPNNPATYTLTVVVKGNGSVSAVEGTYDAGETVTWAHGEAAMMTILPLPLIP